MRPQRAGRSRRGLVRVSPAGLLATAACASAGGLSLPGTSSPPVVLRVAVPSGGSAGALNEAVGTAIDRALPAVNGAAGGRFTLEVLDVPQPSPAPDRPASPLNTTLGPLLSAGTPPDLLVFTQTANAGIVPSQFGEFATRESLLLPLDDHVKATKALALGDFFPAALDVCRTKDRLLGLPLLAAPLLLTYDAQRFDQAGVPRPPAGWDWPRLAAAARRLTRGDDYGFWSGFATATLAALIWQNGGNVLSADKKTALLTEPAAVEAIAFYADFYRGALSPPADITARPPVGPEGIRYNARWWVAMMYQPDWLYPTAPGIGVAELPRGKQAASLLAVPAILAASQKAQDPTRAGAALTALADHVSKGVVPPPRKLPAAALPAIDGQVTPDVAQALMTGLGASRSLVLADVQRTNALFDALNRQLVPSLHRGTQSPRDVAAAANAAVQQLLSQT